MQRMRQLMAWVLCAAYLMWVGGAALSSLLCPCVELHQHSEQCCHDHGHAHPDMYPLQAAHDADFSAPCCDDRHSNSIVLYLVSEDGERLTKSMVRELQPMLQAEIEAPEPLLTQRNTEQSLDRVVRTRLCAVSYKALRAPPVKA
ncbi:MAG: hypothetical protein J6A66_01205 [Alistipes sp.]|nr:hypothetical protein [Alistipes sp.]